MSTADIGRIAEGVWAFLLREGRAPTVHDLAQEIGMPHEWISPRWGELTQLDLHGVKSLYTTPRMFEFIQAHPRVAGGTSIRPTYEALLARLVDDLAVGE